MLLRARHYVILALLTLFLALPGRLTLPPLDRDEPRYMEATEQMLSSGNFLDIRFQNQPRYLQPAGIYWLEASSVKCAELFFGPHIRHEAWPYRIPSLINASLIVPLTAWIGACLFSGEVGILAALFLMASTVFAAESRMATIDTTLLLDILVVEALLLRHFQDRNTHQQTQRRFTWAYWLAMGVGLMLKGPIVLIPGLGTPIALSLVERNFSLWRRLSPQWGWILMIAVGLPWCIGIGIVSHGAFFTHAIGHNLLGKIGHAQESHGFPPGYYLLIALLSFWPGSLFAARALPGIWHHRRTPSVRFLLCWIIPHWIFFELLATKLPHYVLPTYPALAILTAASLLVWKKQYLPRLGKAILSLYAGLWLLAGIAFCFAGTLLLIYMEHLISIRATIALCGSLPLLLIATKFLYHHRPRDAAYCAIGSALLIHMGIFLAVIPSLSQIQLSPRIAATFLQNRPCSNSVLISASYYEPSLVFLAGENTRLLSPSLAAQSLHDHARCDSALIDLKDAASFEETLHHLGMKSQPYAHLSGLNYSTGHKINATLVRAIPLDHPK
ncbi:glycosyl transferase [Saccharibacter sp. 17.LH.SD]|uniref:ArnT family glycosyltransferase n=1 Tax=Saccharibacter sp. 17.LH.SD TaxID=2689393 RepID=UPI00136FAEA9|nr:glycosyltransferase family 39 protein [Saccharibacter sp. 17.LH.SD]MXV45112.1 glycosyl transferase [Saccharibacter sp. 17.LH.SD]